jgi:hypothetical protein
MKYAISSHINYINITEKEIISSLVNSGIDINDIYIFVGGYDSDYGYNKLSESINKYSAPHNSLDFTGLISVIEMNLESDYWFLLHDTLYVGPNFNKVVKEFNYENADYVALTFDTSMNIGSYKWSYMQKRKNEILKYKNNNNDIQSFKKKLINEEDVFLKPKTHYYCGIPRKTIPATDYYKNNTQRIVEYFSEIDLYKIKANWSIKSTYELKL